MFVNSAGALGLALFQTVKFPKKERNSPEEEHQRLEEGSEVVVTIDGCLRIQTNVAKHL